jgi:hypothetical protein
VRVIRVLDPQGNIRRELFNVESIDHTTGSLVVHLADGDQPGRLASYIAARGQWAEAEVWCGHPAELPPPADKPAADDEDQADELPIAAAAARVRTGELPALGVTVEAPPSLGGPVLPWTGDPLALDDAARLRLAMTIECACDMLRCRVVDPAVLTSGELRRCNRYAGHGPTPTDSRPEQPHAYDGDPWPYGPHNHAPECPRHPARYNAGIHAEGQPGAPAGITATTPDPEDTAGWLVDRDLTTPPGSPVPVGVQGHPMPGRFGSPPMLPGNGSISPDELPGAPGV